MRRPFPTDRLAGLASVEEGLPSEEVEARRLRFGPNDIVESVGRPVAELARDTARDPMIWFLMGTATLYAVLGDVAESITLFVSLVPLVAMDAYLHRRTQASTHGLRALLADTARVMRDGVLREVPASEVVVGDLVEVGPAEAFPADGVIVDGEGMQTDESALTGESYPVRKRPLIAEPGAAIVDEEHWGMAGTRLLTGRARMRVAFTGGETLYGAIVHMAAGRSRERTPLQRSVGSLVAALVVAAAGLCVLLATIRLLQGHGLIDAIVSALTLAVAALPEEFPVVLTIFLGVGVYRLARRRALVRRAVAVENIGRVTCICSDKTGTITEGNLRVARVEHVASADARAVLAVAAGASRADSGDPLDRAILEAAAEVEARLPPGEILATFPFTEDRRREAMVMRTADGDLAVVKGAPETILALSSVSREEAAMWRARVAGLGEAGDKVIACASRRLGPHGHHGGEPDRDFELSGLIAISDPVRVGVAESVAWCRRAGVRVLMVTGDHEETARAVARRAGLAKEPVIVMGDDVEQAGDRASEALTAADVVARALPSQKLSIVRALQAAGELVAVTGDGVNDVPALQAADVGIAMGKRGVRSAREVSQIVLMDDDFRSIVAAIGEGRALFRNLQRSFQYLLMVHIPLVLTATLIPLAGYPILYQPVHIVWLEALIHPTAMLVFQERRSLASAPPLGRGREARVFSRRQWAGVVAVGMAVTMAILITYVRSLGPEGDAEHARAMAMVVLTMASAFVTVGLSRLRTRAAWVMVGATLLATAALVQVPPLAHLLHLRPLHLDDWALAAAASAVAAAPVVANGFGGRRRP